MQSVSYARTDSLVESQSQPGRTRGRLVGALAVVGVVALAWFSPIGSSSGREGENCQEFPDSTAVMCIPTNQSPHPDGGYGTGPISVSQVADLMGGIPLLPGSSGGLPEQHAERITHIDGHVRYDSAGAERYDVVTSATPDQIRTWYRSTMPALGWGHAGVDGSNGVTFRKGPRVLLEVIIYPPGYSIHLTIRPYPCGDLDSCGYLGKAPRFGPGP
jgi:hypothetical protein